MELAVSKGFFIGVNGIATFSKNPDQLTAYQKIPIGNLLLETDAPFLTPTPYRGTINQPKHVQTIRGFLAELRGEDRESIAAATTHNARQLFGI
jgi:TatD DNase family protein